MLNTIPSSDRDTIKKRLLEREQGDIRAIQQTVDGIIADVRERGDAALFEYTERFDNWKPDPDTIEVTEEEIERAFAETDPELIDIMGQAAGNIVEFHNRQKRDNWFLDREDGAVLGQLYIPVEYAGVYVPGGKAAYPSSVLMNIIPAKCAGVDNIIIATPAVGGVVNPTTIAAAKIAGAHRILKIGGAQAVAAMAYGTESVPAVCKITGPGNIYVALAKKSVYGQVGIDMIAGPSEVLVIADSYANPAWVAADFISQAEHDEMAACILVTDDAKKAETVKAEVQKQIAGLSRRDIIEASLKNYGTVIICKDMDDCIDTANMIAPEHLELCVREPMPLLSKVKNAGSIFLGDYSPEPLGDYFAGANHVLPTNGTAKFSSPLNVDDFQKKSSVIYYSREAFEKEYKKVEKFALAEGLTAHANSAAIRFEGE